MISILLDSCVWGGVMPALLDAEYDVEWAGAWPQDPGDEAILTYAETFGRILVTLDKDFGELAILKGMPHHGIVRLSGFKATQMAGAIHYVLSNYHEALVNGAMITVDPKKIRVRSHPS